MKKFFILASLLIGTSAFATLSDNGVGGKLITGDYTISALKEANGGSLEFANIILDGSITIDDSDAETASIIKTTTAGKLDPKLSGLYSFISQNNAKLNLLAGSKSSFSFAEGINSFCGNLEINVDKDAGGYVYTPKLAAQKKAGISSAVVTLNLDKAYAIRTSDKNTTFTATVVGIMNFNASADQSIKLDARNNTIMNVNLTNDANLYISSVGINNVNFVSTINLVNGLENGAILFAKDALQSGLEYDAELGTYKVVVKTSEHTEIIKITADEGVDIGALTWSDTINEGYWTLTGMVAVPEPAEWAMIFGGIALGLAIYRRRK